VTSAENKAVFLSYASQDAEAVRRIAEALRASGVEVWFDQNELVGGDAWDAKIRGQIASCALFVPVISAATQARLEGYFRLEWKLAAQRTHTMADEKTFLLPVVIDTTRDSEAKVPMEFKTVQWIKLPGGETPEKLCARVKTLLGGETDQGGSAVGARLGRAQADGRRPAAPRQKPSRSWMIPAMVGVGLVAAVVAFVALRPRRGPEDVAKLVAPPQTTAANSAAKPSANSIADTAASTPLSEAQKLTLKARALIDDDLMAARENFRLAEELCQRAVALAVDNGEAWATLARVSCEIMERNYETTPRRRDLTRSATDRAVRLAPESIEAGLAEAAYLDLVGEFVAAEARLRRLLPLAPNDERVALAYERGLGRVKGVAAAEEFRRTHPALAGNSARSLATQAWEIRGRDYARAQELVDRAQSLAPSRTAYMTKLVLLVVDSADMDAAKTFAEQLPPQLAQEDLIVAHLSRLWLRLKDPARSLAVLNRGPQDFLEEARRVEPKGYLTGRAFELSGKAVAAEAEWKSALAVVERRLANEPNRPSYLRAKALLLALTHQFDEAERTWRIYTEVLVTRRPRDLLEINLTHVEILLAANRVDEAIAELLAEKQWGDSPDLAYVTSLHYDPWFAQLRKDPRVQALIERCEASRDQQLGRSRTPTVSVTAATAGADDKSVAVLAFANLSDDKANEYFSDGISEELLNVLAKVQGLKVTARTSAFHFKGKDTPIPEIARQLGVAYVIEGSVRKAGDKVRITAQLIKAVDGFHVWSDTFTRDLKDVFAVQDEIAGIIAKQLSLKLGVKSNATKATVNPLAYELYLHGRQAWNQRTVEGYNLAEAKFAQAIELDPNFAAAYVGRADAWQLREYDQRRVGRWAQRGSDVLRRIQVEIEHALSLDPNLAEAHASLALNFDHMWDGMAAERELRRAIELNPNYATGFHWLGFFLWSQGWVDEARVALRRAVDLDPFSIAITSAYSLLLLDMGSPAEALAVAERAIALQPDSVRAIISKAAALLNLGRKSDALPLARKLAEGGYNLQSSRGVSVINQAGLKVELETLLARSRKEGDLFLMVKVLAAQGRWDEFFSSWAQLPLPRGESWYLFAPELDVVRHEARFLEPLKKVGLHEAHDRAQAWRKAHPPEKLK
jgi:TolB-like protein/tetratricopeptide (TPR) repeat protein